MAQPWDLSALINAADARASLAERQLWLVRLIEWLRHAPQRSSATIPGAARGGHEGGDGGGAGDTTPWPLRRLKLLLMQLDRQPALHQQVQALAAAFWRDIDAPALYADLGFGARHSFGAELLARVQDRKSVV